jgi:hypothetical protein
MVSCYKNSLPPFRAVRSISNIFWDFTTGIFAIVLALVGAGLIIYLIAELFREPFMSGKEILGLIILVLSIAGAIGFFIYKVVYERSKRYTTTIIDEKGIHYFNRFTNLIVNELLWNQFTERELGKQKGIYTAKFDIDCLSYNSRGARSEEGSITKLFWRIKVNEKEIIHSEYFSSSHLFGGIYTNRRDVVCAFLLGLAHYRPDLTINPWIFIANSINSRDYTFYPKSVLSNVLLVLFYILLMLFILFLLYDSSTPIEQENVRKMMNDLYCFLKDSISKRL